MKSTSSTDDFEAWQEGLDSQTAARIASAVNKLANGLGDIAPVGEGISEVRLHFGPGYRLYFDGTDSRMNVLLCGGTKATQSRDIRRAKAMKRSLK